jgi:hypothetical protein
MWHPATLPNNNPNTVKIINFFTIGFLPINVTMPAHT